MNIPELMKQANRWHCWKNINGAKIPVTLDGSPAKSNDSATWTDYESAESASQFYTGIAFELGDGFCGVDLDNCIDEKGNLKQWAWPIVARFDGVAYAEISPSGTGIKLTTLASKPDGSRCVHKFPGEKEQLECYDKTRFWTVTGNTYNRQTEIGNGQNAVIWLCETYLSTSQERTKAVTETLAVTWGVAPSSDLERRAQAYLDACELPAVGGRNVACFKVAGHLATITDDYGAGMSQAQVTELVEHWALSRGAEPRDGEIAKAVASAMANGVQREEKKPQPMISEESFPGVDISGILNGNTPQPEAPVLLTEFKELPREVAKAGKFPAECLEAPGFIGDLVKHNLENALYPLPELALAGALSLLASVTGGKVEGLRARTNAYIMGIAPSGGGKDYSRELNRQILLKAGAGNICGPERIGSHAGIISSLAENWNTLFQIDEIGNLLATMKNAASQPHLFNISSVLMQIYSSAKTVWQADAYGDRNKCKTLSYPHCVVYGTSVPDGFWESLTPDDLTKGLIGRFLVFENEKYVDFQPVKNEEPIPEFIIQRVTDWVNHKTTDGNLATEQGGSSPRMMEPEDDAYERLTEHARVISDRRKKEDPAEAALWSRHAEKTNKLAVLFACSRWDGEGTPWPKISLEDADRAIALNNFLTRRMLVRAGLYISSSENEGDQLRMLRLIKSRDAWTTTEIARKGRRWNAKKRRDLLEALVETEDITIGTATSSGGRSITVYRAV